MKKNLLLVGALVSAFLLASCSGGDKSKAPVVSTADIENAAEVIKYYNTSLGVLKDMVKEKDVNAVLDYMEQKGKKPGSFCHCSSGRCFKRLGNSVESG